MRRAALNSGPFAAASTVRRTPPKSQLEPLYGTKTPASLERDGNTEQRERAAAYLSISDGWTLERGWKKSATYLCFEN